MAYNTGTTPTLAQLITAKFVPEMYAKEVLETTKSNLVVAPNVNTTYRSNLSKGSVVNIGVMAAVSTNEVTPGTEPSGQNALGTPVSITIDKWKEATIEISDIMQIEDIVGYLSDAAKEAAYAIVKDVDTALGALFQTLQSSSVYGADGQTFTDDIVIAIQETLDEGDVPAERVVIIDPSNRADIFKIDKFVRTDYQREPVVATGRIGMMYGMPVLITNNLTAATTGNYGVIIHKDAIGLVIQNGPRTVLDDQRRKFRTMIFTDIIYGLGVLRTAFGQSFYTRKS
ncbi:hypothetical protein LCGC14_0983600 [marine sediment metagenome]|uniref:Uncharacterized protein n=1 Tax=marine sediment metagenome TaxID=412755 RepID=A0A0F9REG6_9ZZZZ